MGRSRPMHCLFLIMVQSFLTIAAQTSSMFLLMMIGYICGKVHIMDEVSEEHFSSLTLYLIGPSLILTSFEREFSREILSGFLLSLALSAASVILSIFLTKWTFQKEEKKAADVLRSGAVFTNCGMIGFALQSSLYGSEGLFYGVAYFTAFNILVWTYGIALFSGDGNSLNFRKALLNPSIFAIAIGLALFFTSSHLPAILESAVKGIGSMNTPLSMLILGCRLSHVRLRDVFVGKGLWLSAAESLVLIPLLCMLAFRALGLHGVLPIACLIGIASPAGAITSIFAIKFKKEPNLSIRMVSMQTILSMLTMPLLISVAEMFLQ
mgnify:CR=1 FL=1